MLRTTLSNVEGSLRSRVEWRRGWDSNPTGLLRFCKLQILQCRHCRECRHRRGALHAVARTAEVHRAFSPRLRRGHTRGSAGQGNQRSHMEASTHPSVTSSKMPSISTIVSSPSARRPNQAGDATVRAHSEMRIASSRVPSFVVLPHAALRSARQNFDRLEAVHTAETYSANSAV